DIYSIKTSSPVRFFAFLSLLSDNVNLQIAQDVNRDRIIQRSEIIASTVNLGTIPDKLIVNLPTPGTYFVTAKGVAGPTDYGLVFATAPIDNAGDTLATVKNLGVLGAQVAFDDFVGAGSIPAANDNDDFYRFTLGSNGPYHFSAKLTT